MTRPANPGSDRPPQSDAETGRHASSPPASSPGPVLRVDARRNLERVKEEAERLFAERGSDVSVAEVAAAAGVGKATVYRSFPTKDDLLEAVALRRHEWFRDRLQEAIDEPVAWDAWARLLLDLAGRMERDRTLSELLRSAHGRPAGQERKAESLRSLQSLMDRAIADGAMRAGSTARDAALMLTGASMALTNDGGNADDWARLTGYVIDAFRA